MYIVSTSKGQQHLRPRMYIVSTSKGQQHLRALLEITKSAPSLLLRTVDVLHVQLQSVLRVEALAALRALEGRGEVHSGVRRLRMDSAGAQRRARHLRVGGLGRRNLLRLHARGQGSWPTSGDGAQSELDLLRLSQN